MFSSVVSGCPLAQSYENNWNKVITLCARSVLLPVQFACPLLPFSLLKGDGEGGEPF